MFRLASMLFSLVATTLAGLALAVIASVPTLADDGFRLIPIAIGVAIVLAAPASWLIARALMAPARGGPTIG